MFLLSDGVFTSIDYPGAASTGAATIGIGVNPRGEIVGQYRDLAGVTHGFILDAAGYSTFDLSGYPTTVLTGINSHGDIVWRARDADGKDVAFVLRW